MTFDLSSDEDSISDITCNICAKMPCCLIRDKIEIDNCFKGATFFLFFSF